MRALVGFMLATLGVTFAQITFAQQSSDTPNSLPTDPAFWAEMARQDTSLPQNDDAAMTAIVNEPAFIAEMERQGKDAGGDDPALSDRECIDPSSQDTDPNASIDFDALFTDPTYLAQLNPENGTPEETRDRLFPALIGGMQEQPPLDDPAFLAEMERQDTSLPQNDDSAEVRTGATAESEAWRYKHANGHWWYWLPSEKWVFWNGDDWVAYTPEAYQGFWSSLYPAHINSFDNPVQVHCF